MTNLLIRTCLILGSIFFLSCQKYSDSVVNLCEIDAPYSIQEYAGYQVKIYGPNDLESPDIWEGPICITDTTKNSTCSTELSLIKEVRFDSENNKLIVNVFSGSNQESISLSMENCRK